MTDFSYQLYSSRNFPPLSDTLAMVAAAGYAQVEGYGGLFSDDATVESLKRALDATGLTMPTAHMGLDMVRDTPDRTIEIARALGVKAIFVPHTTEQDRDAAGWAAFGRQLAEAGKPLQDAGFLYGWHNHDFEFRDIGADEVPLELILGASDSLMLELDLAWVMVAGLDPVAWIATYADRIVAAHVKDIAPSGDCEDEDGWADVGHGTVEWAPIVAALRASRASYFVMEHDNPSDDKRFAERSIASARAIFGDRS